MTTSLSLMGLSYKSKIEPRQCILHFLQFEEYSTADPKPDIKADINKQIQVGNLVFQSYHGLNLKLFCFNEFT